MEAWWQSNWRCVQTVLQLYCGYSEQNNSLFTKLGINTSMSMSPHVKNLVTFLFYVGFRANKTIFRISLPPYGKHNHFFGKPNTKSDMVDFTIFTKCWENVRKNWTSPPVLGIWQIWLYILKIDEIPQRLLQLLFLVSSPGSQNLSFYFFDKMEPCQYFVLVANFFVRVVK